MHVTLLRNATVLIELHGLRLLVDPMLDPARARPAVANTANQRRNPLVELPEGADAHLRDLDALLVTHLHADHLDETAVARLDHGTAVLCQPQDAAALRERGFADVRPVDDVAKLGPLRVHRTRGSHGTGEIAERLAPVSGFVLEGERTVYVAGDTILDEHVEAALREHRPDVVIVNASGARFLEGDPIVMTADDVARVARARPEARVVAVHLEAINHCLETRADVRAATAGLDVLVPEDGETLEL